MAGKKFSAAAKDRRSRQAMKTRLFSFIIISFILLMTVTAILPMTSRQVVASSGSNIVQEKQGTNTTDYNAICSFTAPVQANDQLLVFISWIYSATVYTTLTDSLGNTLVNQSVYANGLNSYNTQILGGNVTVVGTDTITLTFTGGGSGTPVVDMLCMETTGVVVHYNYGLNKYGHGNIGSPGFTTLSSPVTVTTGNALFAVTIWENGGSSTCQSTPGTYTSDQYNCIYKVVNSNVGIGQAVGYVLDASTAVQGSTTVAAFGFNTDPSSGPTYLYGETFVEFQTTGSNVCTVYACQTSSYTIIYQNVSSVATSCTTTVVTSTFPYDSTSTVETLTNGNGSGCATRTQTDIQTEVFTDTSVSYVVLTDTTTSTVYQINAPNPTQFTFWFFPLLFMGLGIAITLGPVAGVKRGDIGSVNEKTLVTLLLSGLVIGTILGVGAGLVNYVFPIMFITVLIIYLWSSRG